MHLINLRLYIAITQPFNLPWIKLAKILHPKDVKIKARPYKLSDYHLPIIVVPFLSIIIPSPFFC